MEKKEIILDEGKFTESIEVLGCVSSELLKHNGFFNDMLVNGSVSDSQADEIKKLIKSTDLVQKIVLICVTILGKSGGCVLETVEAFFKAITAKFEFESNDEEMEMLDGLAAYFTNISNEIKMPAERTNKDFVLKVKPNGIKN